MRRDLTKAPSLTRVSSVVDIKIVGVDDPSPKATGDYLQVITRKEQEKNPGNIVSDIEHFTLAEDRSQKSMSRETRDIGFREAIAVARDYAEAHDVPVVYATDRTAQDIVQS